MNNFSEAELDMVTELSKALALYAIDGVGELKSEKTVRMAHAALAGSVGILTALVVDRSSHDQALDQSLSTARRTCRSTTKLIDALAEHCGENEAVNRVVHFLKTGEV